MKQQFLDLTGLTELVAYIKSNVTDKKEILPYASNKLFPSTGDINAIYIDTATNIIYRWDESSKTYKILAQAVKSISISESTENGKITLTVDGVKTTVPIHGLKSAAFTESSAYSPADHTHTKAQIGLGNVDNTADKDKSVKHANTADSATAAGTATTATNVSGENATVDAARHVWFSDSGTETKRNYNDKFKYNPATNTVTTNISGSAASANSVLWSGVTNKPSTFTPSAHNHDDSTITSLNASKLFGIIDIARLPHGALERLVIVEDDTARFKLTTANVQLGDTVKVIKTEKMYFVVDESKLSSEAGYSVYTAGTATSVPWSGVTGKPSSYPPASHNHDERYYTETEMNSKLAEKAAKVHTHVKSEVGLGNVDNTADANKSVKYAASAGTAASCTGNAATATTATKLATARSINGTNFDGSGNITTATWGTARNITIGSTKKSVNGGADVSWSLSEIGAAAASHSHSYLPLSGGLLSGELKIGSSLKLWSDNEGANIRLFAPNSTTNCFEFDVYDGNLRLYYSNQGGSNAVKSWSFRSDGTITSSLFSGNLSGTASKATQTKAMEEIQLNDTSITTYLDTTANIHRSTEQGELNLYRFFANKDESNYSKTYGLPAVDNHALVFSIDKGNKYNRIIDLDIRSTEIYTKAKLNGSWSDWIRILTSANYSQYVIPLTGSVVSNPNASNFSISKAMTGNLLFSNTGDTNGNALGIGGVNGANDGWAIRGYQTSQNRGCLEIAVGDDGDEGIYVRQYTSGQYKLPFMNKAGSASGLTYREIVLMEPGTGNSIFPGTVTAATFKGVLSGNASTATALTSSAGSATQPVYFSGGKPVACSYTINASVPSGAKFTDTNTWRPLGTTGDTACAGNDSRLSNARPASDVYSWAKASSKPSYSWGEITGKPSTFAPAAHSHNKVSGAYTGNGGQQKPNYFGTNQVGFLMMNTAVNNNTHYKDWIIMDCYSGSDVGGAVAFGVNRQSLGAYIMRSESGRASWAESAELLHTSNYTSYTVTKTGSGASGTWGINVSGGAAYPTGFSSRVTSATWGNQTGTLITDWHTSNGGDIQFRDNNGQLNVIIDGIFYQNEGRNVVLDSANYASYAATKNHTHNYAGSSSAGGNANAAVKLATARTINGTSFNGSANITTANWGTARTITVGNTGKSVNGSGNVSWSLGEIGVHVSNKEPAASDGKNGDVWIVYEG